MHVLLARAADHMMLHSTDDTQLGLEIILQNWHTKFRQMQVTCNCYEHACNTVTAGLS